MSLEGFSWFVAAQLTNMNTLNSGARGEADIRLPIYIECWGGMKGKLLRALACWGVPNDGRLMMNEIRINNTYFVNINNVYFVDSSTEDIVAFFVPF